MYSNRVASAIAASKVFITDEVRKRPVPHNDYYYEKQCVYALVQQMLFNPGVMLAQLVDVAMAMTKSTSAGLSLYDPARPDILKCMHVRGKLKPLCGMTFPIHSPCGLSMSSGEFQLTSRPERTFEWIADARIDLPEILHVPLWKHSEQPLGVLWMVADTQGHFDLGHVHAVQELGSFLSIALTMTKSKAVLLDALDEQAALAGEMRHRVRNVFAVVNAIVRMSAQSASTVDDMVDNLSGRLLALANAQTLALSTTTQEGTYIGYDLKRLVLSLIKPYEASPNGSCTRFRISGRSVLCGERALNSLALVLHELATNALKYGALSKSDGSIDVDWDLDDEMLHFRWIEEGVDRPAQPNKIKGFGTKLLQDIVVRRLVGELAIDWEQNRLKIAFSLPRYMISGCKNAPNNDPT